MGLFDRFFRKQTAKPASQQPAFAPSITRNPVPERRGNMTAHEAWAVAAPTTKALDPEARLTFITSGLDLGPDGLSLTWEFIFFLPGPYATIMLSLEPDPESEDVDTTPCVLIQRIHPAAEIDSKRPAFPEPFRDSPEVVAELAADGVDFVAGPGEMKLEGRVLPSGEAEWITYYWDDVRSTSFQA